MEENMIEGDWLEASKEEQKAADDSSSAYWRFYEETLNPKIEQEAALNSEIGVTEAETESRSQLDTLNGEVGVLKLKLTTFVDGTLKSL
jgi:hypothetical protein